MGRISNKVIRQIERDLGSEDAPGKLAELREFLKGIDNTPEGIDSILAGFPEFLNSIMHTYRQYEDQNKVAIRNVQLSSQELNDLNNKLEFLNASMNAMLESLGQGLLFFNREGVCAPVYSKASIALLESEPAGRFIWDVLGLPPGDAKNFQTLVSLLLDNHSALSFEDLVDLAPSSKRHGDGRKIDIEYRPMYGGGKNIQGVLVIATDKTEEEKARALLAQKEQDAARILRLARNRNPFQKFMSEVQEYFLSGKNSGFRLEPDLESIKRAMHTFKGLAGTFFMPDFVDALHKLEDNLIGAVALPAAQKLIAEQENFITAQVETIVKDAEGLFGIGFVRQGQTRNLPLEKLNDFYARHLQANSKDPVALEFMRDFLAIPIWRKLDFFNAQVLDTAARLGKTADPCHFEGDNFPILEAPYNNVFTSFTHIASNIVDHALEAGNVRMGQRKPEAGQIRIKTSQTDTSFIIEISDDGAGISEQKIREKLAKKGVDTSNTSAKDILMTVFQPDFSTAASISSTSGRGVGLNVVHEEVKALGGDIALETELGKGTKFTITLPIIWAV